MTLPRIAMDMSTLDTIHRGSGQFRYLVDLVKGLADLRPPAEFVILGSQPSAFVELAPVLEAEHGRWTYRRLDHSRSRAGLVLDQFAYRRLLASERIDLFHTPHSFLPLLARCPCVATIYDLMTEIFPEYRALIRSRRHRLFRWSVRRHARRVMAISRATATDLERLWGVEPGRVDVTLLGTRLGSGAPVPASLDRFALDPAAPVLLSPYNLEPRKNQDALVEAFARLKAERPTLRLVLYGRAAITPEREAAFERLVGSKDLARSVVRTGLLNDAELDALYRRATVFVFPSLYEGFGLPVLEAMANGCCVVARGVSAMPEVLGEAGVIVETRDPEALAACVAGLLDDPERRRALGAAAKARAATFTIERMARETWGCYARALGRDPEAP